MEAEGVKALLLNVSIFPVILYYNFNYKFCNYCIIQLCYVTLYNLSFHEFRIQYVLLKLSER